MGAPKQKWTSEEEAALKAGIHKHGTGKWRTILSDPEFSLLLKSRSNVDLKDKWRNINVTALYGSRKKAKLALKLTPLSGSKQDDDNTTKALLGSYEPPNVDEFILEAITNFEIPFGPDEKSILTCIEESFKMQSDMKRIVTSRLKYLTNAGTLLKVKNKYKISQEYMTARGSQRSPQLCLEGNKENSPKPEENGVKNLTKYQIDGELCMIKDMTGEETAARAVAEAEFAIAEAEEAAREADEAEAEAEAAQIFAIAAMKALKYCN